VGAALVGYGMNSVTFFMHVTLMPFGRGVMTNLRTELHLHQHPSPIINIADTLSGSGCSMPENELPLMDEPLLEFESAGREGQSVAGSEQTKI
jgi:hypothetical protein